MNALLARVLMLVLVIGIAACTEHDPCCASLPGGGHYCLQPTTALAPFDAQQKIEVIFNGRRETIIVEIESDADGLRFIGLTPFGHKLMQVSYDNHAAKSATMPDTRLDPALLLALLQLSLWPADVVRNGLSMSLTLEESDNTRRILSGDDILLTVKRTGSKLPYRQLRLTIPSVGFVIDVENLGTLPIAGKEQ